MKNTIIPLSAVAIMATIGLGITSCTATEKENREDTSTASHENDERTEAASRDIVKDFYTEAFLKKDLASAADKYISSGQYVQHNPSVENGKHNFVEALGDYVSDPNLHVSVSRVIAEDDMVVVHATWETSEASTAVADIFRVENEMIVEHWDVQQTIPERTASDNPMV